MGIALLVYADTYQHYEFWCHQNHYSPRNPLLCYVSQPLAIQGRRPGTPIICVDPAPYWLLEDIASHQLNRVRECPQPLVEFHAELDERETEAPLAARQQSSYTRALNALIVTIIVLLILIAYTVGGMRG